MDQKEYEIQRALGTVELFWITLWTRNREEYINIDALASKVFPVVTRYLDGESSCFSVEAHFPAVEEFMSLLHDELSKIYKQIHITVHQGISEEGPELVHKWVGYKA